MAYLGLDKLPQPPPQGTGESQHNKGSLPPPPKAAWVRPDPREPHELGHVPSGPLKVLGPVAEAKGPRKVLEPTGWYCWPFLYLGESIQDYTTTYIPLG